MNYNNHKCASSCPISSCHARAQKQNAQRNQRETGVDWTLNFYKTPQLGLRGFVDSVAPVLFKHYHCLMPPDNTQITYSSVHYTQTKNQ